MAKLTHPIRAAVAGVGGYSGGELARILLAHPGCAPPLFLGRAADASSVGNIPLEQLHPQLALGGGQTLPPVQSFSWNLVDAYKPDVVFLALPHETSREWAPEWLARGIRVVDLSGAWRLQHASNRAVYKLHDADPTLAEALQHEAVYGSPELNGPEIARARLIANPGCYATSVLLALAPLLRANLVDLNHGIIADAKSGVSGAGKAATAKTHFMYAADNLSAYAVFGHRHTGELLEQLHLTAAQIQFTPHLLPIPRGILSTIYVRLSERTDPATLQACFDSFYASSPMVRVRRTPDLPQIAHAAHTPYCDLGFELAADGQRLLLISCLDNLLKGASSQAVQNMNLLFGLPEQEGLL